jgi:probable ATP-dependent RNA helicase DDX4
MSSGFNGFRSRDNNQSEEKNSGFSGFGKNNEQQSGSVSGFGASRFNPKQDGDGERKTGFSGFKTRDENRNDAERKPGTCYNCGDGSHMSRECPNPKKEQRSSNCYNCGEDGHMSRDCPNPKKERTNGGGGSGSGFGGRRDGESGESRPRSCFNCGEEGHMSRDCPNPKKEQKNENGEEIKKERYIPPPIDDNDLFHTITTGVNFKKQAEIPVNVSGEDADIKPLQKFSDAKLSDLLSENIARTKYETPTPVQQYAIPIMLKRRDLMACAQTGSGKTAAYLIPIMTNILEDGIESGYLAPVQTPQALILAPTRELAIQIYSECKKFSYNSIIRSAILYGGTVTKFQVDELAKGTNIVVATPGRLLDILSKGILSFDKLKYVVLDEADRMLDLGFEGEVRKILDHCKRTKTERCTFMFSATFPAEIQKLAQDFLNNYLFLTVGIVGGANADVEQIIYKATKHEKREKLFGILNEIGNERTMVFVESKSDADILALLLIQKGYPTTSIHGDRLQSQREAALKDFKTGKCKIIVCTSVAARGLDISDVNHVINVDLPQSIDEYVHRIGRTGRCGNIGRSISFFDPKSDKDHKLARGLVRILMQANKDIPDWLNAIAEDTHGSSFNDGKCTDDLRSNFKSLAVSSPAAPAAEDETWD